ncbi:hypothetical protein [Paraburkholderia fungorum]|uniref:hypothetical protein n=1 Tax=Paraburkholderia fungorum TaxID=134537 RepID=UPI0011C49E1D|nr:hypothetical protein [Paraburkholderia fungorum]
MGSPLISVVVPTSGKEKNLSRCINSLAYNAPKQFLAQSELIVFLNEDPISPINYERIDAYLATIKDLFGSLKVVRAARFELTAEESAHSASEHATGKFIWLVGDKRIFLPEGLRVLSKWLEAPTAPAAYFNSAWISSNALTNNYTSTHLTSTQAILPYKLFVMSTGINYMATNMGTWIFERRCLDREIWGEIIKRCGPHFSHVTTALATLGEESLQCFSLFLCQMESKAYHTGDDTEWVRYSRLTNTYRFYAWTLGLVRQFQFLVDRGVYEYADIRRSMCSEGVLLRRQIDEIYTHVAGQLRQGWFDKSQRVTQEEFEEIYQFLVRVCPEKIILNDHLRDIFNGYDTLGDKDFSRRITMIYDAFGVDFSATRFGSLIVSQIGDQFLRLHPKGFVLSPVKDNEDFLLAYKFPDAPAAGGQWKILSQAELDAFENGARLTKFWKIIPEINYVKPKNNLIRKFTAKWVVRFYRRRIAYKIVSLLPGHIKRRLKAMLM